MMFRIHDLREIIKLIDQSSFQEFELESEGTKISIRKGISPQVNGNVSVPAVQVPVSAVEPTGISKSEPPVSPPVQQRVEAIPAASNSEPAVDENLHTIVSPMVGTFYSKPDPSAPVFVKVGDHVKPDSIVCIVEAMKLFNEIEAEVSGEIVKVLVSEGQLVEYGQPLFLVKSD